MYEYAISDGEGTLVEFGIIDGHDIDLMPTSIDFWDKRTGRWRREHGDITLIISPCSEDCETGR